LNLKSIIHSAVEYCLHLTLPLLLRGCLETVFVQFSNLVQLGLV
jgi:hypothetical protein